MSASSASDKSHPFDLLIIGAGSGGVRLARMSAARGARVAVVESRYLGGTCVNVGCVPKKLFVYASEVKEALHQGRGFGWSLADESQLRFDWQQLVSNKNREIERLNGIYQQLLADAGVTLLRGTASLLSAHQVQVMDAAGQSQVCEAERIVIATGGWPQIPDIPGKAHFKSSNEMFFLEKLPQRAVVLGGGYIAVEFAGILNGLGVETHLVYRGELFLRGFDEDVRQFVATELRKKGIHLHFNENITHIESVQGTADDLRVYFEQQEPMQVGLALAATGRKALTDGLNLAEVGVKLKPSGEILVDSAFQTSVPSIYALGDVIGTPQLTPVALAQGMNLSNRLFGDSQAEMDYETIPTAVFCQPNIGTVGPTEAEARRRYGKIRVYRSAFRALKHTLSGDAERTLMKLLVDDATDRVIAAHMVGEHAGEIIQGIAIAIKAGATKAIFDATIGIHPTAAEEFVTMRQPV